LNLSTRGYLIEEPEREHDAVRALVQLRFIAEKILCPLAINVYFCWFILRLRKDRLLPARVGDIDLLAGLLEWNDPNEFPLRFEEAKRQWPQWHESHAAFFAAQTLANEGRIKWPPPTSHLVAIEAKCAYLNPAATDVRLESFKSTKMSKAKIAHTRAQIRDLLDMGFDRVALLDVIANPPGGGADGQAWLAAGSLADDSRRVLMPALARRLSSDTAAGHWVWSAGAVLGGNESQRGAGYPLEVRTAVQNPLLSDRRGSSRRKQLEEKLRSEFENLPAPLNLDVVFVDCDRCRKIHHGSELCDCKVQKSGGR
jgi:hypothetical protein